MDICIYYDEKTQKIMDILPKTIDSSVKYNIESTWTQEIPRKILIALSREEKYNVTQLREITGHSMSTLHENIKKLEDQKLISTQISYIGNKQKILQPNILCVTKNPKHRELIKKFFKGLWIDSNKTKEIIAFMEEKPDKYFTKEEISLKTGIPVDDVELLLSNWDSHATRGISDFLKECPFEKKVLYRAKANKENTK